MLSCTLRFRVFLVVSAFLLFSMPALAQSVTATLSGVIKDKNDAVVPDATVRVVDPATRLERNVQTNDEGQFVVPLLPPSKYDITIERAGFAPYQVIGLTLNANDQKTLNLRLDVGPIGAQVEITSEGGLVDENPAVGTNVDRDLINNMPLSGRSLQSLIRLAPGVVVVPSGPFAQGQFSVNGQRSNSNYFSVDGVSGNFGTTNAQDFGSAGSGSTPSTSSTGGFTNLASIDALQEFTIQTSTTSAQFGRSPGAQVAFTTRSGTNNYQGSLFEYFRNDVFDARDFFDIRKAPLRFNDFGGTFGGPLPFLNFGEGGPIATSGKDKTFFFFSYEGQRFTQPQAPIVNLAVPSLATRNAATNPIIRSIVNAFPLPNGAEIRNTAGALTGGAFYSATYSNPTSLDSYSLRIDHRVTKNISMFVRGNYSPSNSDIGVVSNPSAFTRNTQKTETLTAGSTQVFTSKLVNEFTANYSRQGGDSLNLYNGNGGGVQPDTAPFFPPGFPQAFVQFVGPANVLGSLTLGPTVQNRNKQLQFVDNLSYTFGSHNLKFGADYRRLTPLVGQEGLQIIIQFGSLARLLSNTPLFVTANRNREYTAKFETYSFYAQDTWKANRRLTLDYGVRWEIAPSPTAADNSIEPVTLAVAPDLSQLDQSGLTLAPLGTPYYETEYTNFAPRFGISYLVSDKAGRELVLRGGIGIYYDLGQSPFGGINFPYSQTISLFNTGSLPLQASSFNFPPVNFTPSPTNRGRITVAGSDYTQPRTYQFNVTAEQSLGTDQTLSVAYVGALGRKLVRTRTLDFGTTAAQVPGAFFSPNFSRATIVDNGSESSYHSMQAQFNRRLSQGLQGLVSYTWSHSIDNGSNESALTSPGFVFPQSVYYGDSDFDVRHSLNGALSYALPMPKLNKFSDAILRGWSINGLFTARSGLPYNVTISEFTAFGSSVAFRRPNLTGQPLYIDAPVATGRQLNPAAFNFAVPAGQIGNLGRNALRGPGVFQVDMGLQRSIPLTEKVSVQIRAEAFNIFNRANFLYPTNTTNITGTATVASNFGIITQTAARGFGGGGTFGGGFNPLFQIGGPRSMQFSARLSF